MTGPEVLAAWESETEPWADDWHRPLVQTWLAKKLVRVDGEAAEVWWQGMLVVVQGWGQAGANGKCPWLDTSVMGALFSEVSADAELSPRDARDERVANDALRDLIRARLKAYRLPYTDEQHRAYVEKLQRYQADLGTRVFDGFCYVSDGQGGEKRGGPIHPALLAGCHDLLPQTWHTAVGDMLRREREEAERAEAARMAAAQVETTHSTSAA